MRIADRLIRPVALLALTLGFPGVALGDAFAGDHCPHHDSLPAEHSAPGGVGHGGHANHSGHALDADAGKPDTHGHEHGGPCNCIGQCVTQVGVALPSTAIRSAATTPSAMPTHVTAVAAEMAVIDPPYLHPYANAPPSPR
ncbi:MAG: hypothetical protein ACREM1_07190 [Longimicrobiales bacterium]